MRSRTIELSLSEKDALAMLATISTVHRRLDAATVNPAPPIYARGHHRKQLLLTSPGPSQRD